MKKRKTKREKKKERKKRKKSPETETIDKISNQLTIVAQRIER